MNLDFRSKQHIYHTMMKYRFKAFSKRFDYNEKMYFSFLDKVLLGFRRNHWAERAAGGGWGGQINFGKILYI